MNFHKNKPTLVVAVFSLLTSLQSHSQTSAENLQNAVEKYNALREYCNGLALMAIDEEAITITKNRMDNALKNVPAAVTRSPEAALAAAAGALNEKTLQLFELSYRNKQPVNASFHSAAESYARKAFSSYPSKATIVGIYATDQMAAAVSLADCAGINSIIQNYTFWKETAKASQFTKNRLGVFLYADQPKQGKRNGPYEQKHQSQAR